jgi:hypothetical protein
VFALLFFLQTFEPAAPRMIYYDLKDAEPSIVLSEIIIYGGRK